MSDDRNQMLELLLARRSATLLTEPGPTRAQLDAMLLATATVPDHGRLRPFRLVVVEGEGRAAFGDALGRTALARRPDLPAGAVEKMREKAFRSPTIIVLIATPKPGKIETWEQHATAACAGYAICLAAQAVGVGAVWKSVPFTKGAALTELFGLADTDEMLGFIHLGTPNGAEAPVARDTSLSSVGLLDGAALTRYAK